jgi:hypothetical protein
MKLEKGKKAATPKGMTHNVKVMEKAGYSKKRAIGTAYGEVGMEKKARKDEAKAMEKKSATTKKAVISHLKKDNKDCIAENKEHNKLIRKMKKG